MGNEARPTRSLAQLLVTTGKRSGGLGLLLAWMYCAFFSCGLIPHFLVLRSSERVWFWIGIGTAACALVLAVLRTQRAANIANSKAAGCAGALCAAVGSCFIWLAFSGAQWNQALSTAGGLFAGAGLALMAVIWGQRLSGFEVSKLERTVPEAFIIAFALYFLLLMAKGALFLLACILMPAGSMLLAFRYAGAWACPFENECACGPGKPMEATVGAQVRAMAPILILYFLMWMQFSSFRLISSPAVVGDRFMHYLVPFSCAALVAIGLFLLCMRASRFLNYSLMYRWAIPLMMLGCVIFLAGPNERFDFRSVAYAANFVGMFGVQLTLWLITPKTICRMGFNPVLAFCGFLVAEGLGVAAGLGIALPFIGHEGALGMLPLALTTVIAAVAMSAGFMPEWFFAKQAVNPLFAVKESSCGDRSGSPFPVTATGCNERKPDESSSKATCQALASAQHGEDVSRTETHANSSTPGAASHASSSADDALASASSADVGKPGAPSRNAPGIRSAATPDHGFVDAIEDDQRRSAGSSSTAAAAGNKAIASLFESQARLLQREFGLTERETEVCALLLAGRSRPFIRDELFISLNTVHTHAHNIFQKCEVKSQQELMSLPGNLGDSR